MADNDSGLEIGEPVSNSSRTRYIHLRKTLGRSKRGMLALGESKRDVIVQVRHCQQPLPHKSG